MMTNTSSRADADKRTRRIFTPRMNKQVATTLTEEMHDELIEFCAEAQRTPAALLRDLIADHLAKQRRKRAAE
jgi:hypothetical protein